MEIQQVILSSMDQSVVYPKSNANSNNKEQKQSEKDRRVEEFKQVIIHGPLLREKFNLAMTPQSHRILAYLRSGDESAFKGLKRRS